MLLPDSALRLGRRSVLGLSEVLLRLWVYPLPLLPDSDLRPSLSRVRPPPPPLLMSRPPPLLLLLLPLRVGDLLRCALLSGVGLGPELLLPRPQPLTVTEPIAGSTSVYCPSHMM